MIFRMFFFIFSLTCAVFCRHAKPTLLLSRIYQTDVDTLLEICLFNTLRKRGYGGCESFPLSAVTCDLTTRHRTGRKDDVLVLSSGTRSRHRIFQSSHGTLQARRSCRSRKRVRSLLIEWSPGLLSSATEGTNVACSSNRLLSS